MKFLKSKSFWLVVVASVCGLAASLSAKQYLQDQVAEEKARLKPNIKSIDVVVAKADMKVGDMVSESSMAVRSVPLDFVPSQAVRPERFETFQGNRLNVPVKAGEMLLRTAVSGAELSTFSAKVRPGVRAMTVAVDEVNSISGMLQPGDRIDLLFSTKNPLAGSGQAQQLQGDVTVPFMQNVSILATGKQLRPGDDGKTQRQFATVTIEADATQAQRLVVAQRAGKLTALLRNPDDKSPLVGSSMDLAQLLAIKTRTEVARPAPEKTQIIVGGQRVQDVRENNQEKPKAPQIVGALPSSIQADSASQVDTDKSHEKASK